MPHALVKKTDYDVAVKKDGRFYAGHCLEIPQARGQGNTVDEAVEDVKKATVLCRAYLEDKRKDPGLELVTVSI